MIAISLPVQVFINDTSIEATAQFYVYPAVFIGHPIDDNLEKDEIELVEFFDDNQNEIECSKEQEEELLMQGLRHYYQLKREKKEELECYKDDFEQGFLFDETKPVTKPKFFHLI